MSGRDIRMWSYAFPCVSRMTGPGSIGLAGAADVQCVGCVPGLIMRHIKVPMVKNAKDQSDTTLCETECA